MSHSTHCRTLLRTCAPRTLAISFPPPHITMPSECYDAADGGCVRVTDSPPLSEGHGGGYRKFEALVGDVGGQCFG